MGIFYHYCRNSFVRSDTDVGRECLARSLRSNSSQRCSIRLRSGLWAGQSSSSTPNWLIQVFTDLALCTGAQSCWSRNGPSPNCFHKVRATSLGMLKHSEFLSLELRGQAQLLQKTTPHHYTPSTKLYTCTVQSDKYRSPGNRHTQTCPSDCQMEKRDSSLQCSRVQ